MNAKEELTKLLMESYDRGIKDTKQEALTALEKAVLAEREACAKLCDEYGDEYGEFIADVIRSRGQA